MPKKKNSRAAAGAGSIRQRSNGLWEGRYCAGFDPGSGKLIRRSIYAKTEKEVVLRLRQILASVDAGVNVAPSKLTLSQWLDIWVSEYTSNTKPNTVSSYRAICQNHLKPNIGAVKLTALSPHAIQAAFNRLNDSGLSAKTLKNVHGCLHQALHVAVELSYLKNNPADYCKLPRAVRTEIKPLDEEKMDAFMEAINGHKWRTVYLVALFTGMRQGEILGLKWADVSFENGTILIKNQLQKNRNTRTYEIITPKSNKNRRITPAPSVMDALRVHRREQSEWRLRVGSAWEDSDLCFTDEFGKHLIPVTVYKNFKKIVADLGIPEARFHDLRHSYAVASLQAGDDVKTLSENLGHHAAGFTLDQYAHSSDKMKKESAARMERFIKARKST